MAELLAHGIQNDESDFRVHVCVKARAFYVYSTRAIKLMELSRYREAEASQKVPGTKDVVVTAKGRLVRWRDIPGCREFRIPPHYLTEYPISIDTDHEQKRIASEAMVKKAIEERLFVLKTHITYVRDISAQIKGYDLRIYTHVQVKCDFPGGNKDYGGTGNLFIQTAESNPFKRY